MSAGLRVGRTLYPVTALGPGRRLGVWVQGCTLSCPGCMSRDTWDPRSGQDTPVADLLDLWRAALDAGADGLTVSGGEPLQQPLALRAFLDASAEVRAGREADILVYTGYEESELDRLQLRAVAAADVLVTGRYDVTKPTKRIWRGSANQAMVPRTDLGRRRYAQYLEYEPENPPLQLGDRPGGVWIIGTPRRGTLSGLESGLRALGMGVDDVTWRP
ncbi:4Fe-4S single cluster domain-containing protein [Actinokineospora sp. 24-640]